MSTEKPVHTLVLDTGAIIRNEPAVSTLIGQSESLVTVPEIISEIRDAATRSRVETTLLPFLSLKSPSPASVKFVTDFARKTGDLVVLSKPDIYIIALTYEIECERNRGDWRLRKTPGQKGLNGAPPSKDSSLLETEDSPPESLERTSEPETASSSSTQLATEPIAGHEEFSENVVASTTEQANGAPDIPAPDQSNDLNVQQDTELAKPTSHLTLNDEASSGTQYETLEVTPTIPKDVASNEPTQSTNGLLAHEPPNVVEGTTSSDALRQATSTIPHQDVEMEKDDSLNDTSAPTEDGSPKVDSAQPSASSQEEETDSDSGGWITPSNLKKQQAKDAGASISQAPEPKTMQVAVLTTDFAMQNVILQINLNLLSRSMTRVKHLKTFVLRCHACFNISKDMTKQFCPKCGQPTLTRVSCSTNVNGEFKLHLKKNMQWNTRGDRYSIPKAVHGAANGRVKGGGKGGWGNDLILTEDQKEYERASKVESRQKERSLMDEDYLPSILTGDRGRAGGRIKVGAGRHVNSKKR